MYKSFTASIHYTFFLSSELGNTELKLVYLNFYPELLASVFSSDSLPRVTS